MEIMDKLRDVSRSVAAKSGEFAESGKLTLNIRKKEREIRTLELEIGKQVYEAYKNGHIFDEKIAEKCLKIDTVCTEIDRLEAEKEKLGLDDLDVEVVDAELPVDEDFEVSEEDNEILRDL